MFFKLSVSESLQVALFTVACYAHIACYFCLVFYEEKGVEIKFDNSSEFVFCYSCSSDFSQCYFASNCNDVVANICRRLFGGYWPRREGGCYQLRQSVGQIA
jgi:hypothetical protein